MQSPQLNRSYGEVMNVNMSLVQKMRWRSGRSFTIILILAVISDIYVHLREPGKAQAAGFRTIEYLRIVCIDQQVQACLNNAGQDGWDLFTVYQSNGIQNFILKRSAKR